MARSREKAAPACCRSALIAPNRPGPARPRMADWAGTVALSLGLALAAPAAACTAITSGVELCTKGTAWAEIPVRVFQGDVLWDSPEIFMIFENSLSEAAADGPLSDRLDRMADEALSRESADVRFALLRRDRFRHGDGISERAVVEFDDDGEITLGALMLTEFPGDKPRLVWSIGSFDGRDLAATLTLIEDTAQQLTLTEQD